jgi:hypothetical protein
MFERAPRLLLGACLLAACSADRAGSAPAGDQSTGNANADDPTTPDAGSTGGWDAGPGSDESPPIPVDCDSAKARVPGILTTNCAPCHGPTSKGEGGFKKVLDTDALIADGKIIPGNPEGSPLYMKIESGVMPPAERTQRPDAEDQLLVKEWITCLAPPAQPECLEACLPFHSIDERLQTMLTDLQAQPADQRADVRYLDLNAISLTRRLSEIQELRDGLSYLLNSLSTGPLPVAPQFIDSPQEQLIFRIKLSDYGWTPAIWEKLVAVYPYAVTYDQNAVVFPHDETSAETLRTLTATKVPYLQADWFFAHAIRPPLYYDLLALPPTLKALQTSLGIDISANIAANKVARAGFDDSGASNFNRVIERHLISEERGALWLTYDFSAGAGASNVLTHPLDFVSTSSEIAFDLPNGFPAYLIVDAAGNRLDKAPNNAVQDPLARDLALEAGISCISCHAGKNLLPHADKVHAAAPLIISDPAVLSRVLTLYPAQATLDDLFTKGNVKYDASIATALVSKFASGAPHRLDDAYNEPLTLEDVAGVFGLSREELLHAIDTSPRTVPAELLALESPDARIARDNFEAQFAACVTGLGLGQPLAK